MYQPSDELRKHIMDAEGFREKAYDDLTGKTLAPGEVPKGKATIGFGDTHGDMSKPVNVDEATRRMNERLNQGYNELTKRVTRKNLTQQQWDALVDMEYNVGITKLVEQGFIDRVNNGTDDQIVDSIRSFTKAKGPSGEMTELPGLKDRAEFRARMWLGGQGEMQAEESDGFSDALAELNADAPQDDGFADAINEMNSAPVSIIDKVKDAVGSLINSSEMEDPAALAMKQEAAQLSKNTVLSEQEARELLDVKDAKSLDLETRFTDIAKNFPVTSTWASNPDNYVVLKEKGDWALKLESSARPLNTAQMAQSYLKTTQKEMERAAIWAQFTLGNASKQQTLNALRILDKEIDAEKLARQSTASKAIGKSFSQIVPSFEELGKRVQTFIQEDDQNYKTVIDGLKKIYDGSDEAFGSIMNALETLIKNPEGAVQFIAESAGGSAIAGVAGGAAGAAGGAAVGGLTPVPFGTGVGAAMGYKSGSAAAVGLYSFGAYIDEAIKEGYTDKSTGVVDYDAAMSDPRFLKKVKRQAATYGVTLAGADYLLNRMAGKFAKELPVGAGKAAVAKEAAKALGAQAGVEAGSEFTAREAADVVGGEASIAKTFKNIGEATVEGITAGVMGGARLTGATAIEQAKQTVNTVKTAMSALDDFNTLQEVRKNMGKVDPKEAAATAELLNQATKEQKPDLVPSTPVKEDQKVDSYAVEIDDAADKGMVEIKVADLEKYLETKGLSAAELTSIMGPEIYDAYVNAKENGAPISVPMGTWAVNTQEFADIDELVNINGNEITAVEAAQTLDEIKKNPFMFFEQIDGQDVPESMVDIVDENAPVVTQMVETVDPETGMVTSSEMRPIDIKNRFRDEASRKAFSSIQKRLRAVTKGAPNVSPEYVDFVAELQYRHTAKRARILNQSIDQVMSRIKIGKLKSADAAGAFIPPSETQGPYKILLNEKATDKTTVHELSHSWLFEMSDDYFFMSQLDPETMNADQKEYWQAMQDAAELLGMQNIGELNNKGVKEQERIQETFAQTAEKYVFEGKFENSRIRRLMESFRKYMTKIAFMVAKTYPQFPPLKLTPQVERLFEVLLDATNAQQDELYSAFPPALPNLDILGREGDKYRETYRLALSEAVANFYGKIFRMNIKEREAAIDKAINDIYDDATREIDAQPPFLLLKYFQDAYNQAKERGLETPRISFKSFTDTFADGDEKRAQQLKAIIPSVFVEPAKKGGVDAVEIMYALGITNPEGFLNYMIQAGKRDETIELRANELIKERFPIMRSDQEIHAAAVEAVNKYGRERLLADEFRIMADKYMGTLKQLIKGVARPAAIPNKLVAKDLMAKAATIIGSAPRAGFGSGKYLRASNALGREAAKKFVAGDFEAAFLAKSQEAEQFYAYRQAQVAVKQMAKVDQTILKFVQFMRDAGIAKRKDATIMKFGLEVLAASKNGAKIPYLSRMTGIEELGVDTSTVEAIDEAINTYMIEAVGKNQSTLTVAGYLALGDVLARINHAAAKAKEVELEGRKAIRKQLVEQVVAEVGPRKQSDPLRPDDSKISNYLVGLRNVQTEFQSLFASDLDYSGSVLGKLYRPVQDAEAARTNDFDARKEIIGKAFKKLFKYDSVFKAVSAAATSRLPGKLALNPFTRPIVATELNYTFTNIAEVLTSLLYAGSESGRKKMILGMNWGQTNTETGQVDDRAYWKFIERMIEEGKLTQDHFDFLQTVFDQFAELYPQAKEAMRYTDGIDLGYVTPMAIKTSLGTIKGGYVPLKPKDMKNHLDDKLTVDNEMYPIGVIFPQSAPSFAKNRTEDSYALDMDLSKITMALAAVANVAYMRKPMYDMASILNAPEVKQALEARRPGIYAQQIRPWYDRTKLQQYTPPQNKGDVWAIINGFARILRQRVAIAFYFANWKTVVRQTTGLGPVAAQIGATRVSTAVSRMAAAPKETREFIESKSVFMKQRLKTSTSAIIQSYTELEKNFDWLTWTDDKIKKYNYLPMQIMQNMVDMPAWTAAYQKAIDEGLAEKEAVFYADNIVQNTQGATTVSALSNIQFGSEIHRLFTTLSTYQVAMNQRLGNIALREGSAKEKALAVAVLGFYTVAMVGVLNSALAELSDDEDDEAKSKKGQNTFMDDMGVRMFTEAIDTAIPVLGRLGTSALTGPRVSLSPVLDQLNQIPTAARAADMATEGIELTNYEIRALFNTFGLFVHPTFTVVGKGLSFSEPELAERKAAARLRRRQLRALKRESR